MSYEFTELSREVLIELYYLNGVRCKEIGSLVGVGEEAVIKLLQKHSIPVIPRHQKRSDIVPVYKGSKKSVRRKLSREKLIELYKKGLSDDEIGSFFNLTGRAVAYRRKKYGISLKVKPDRTKELKNKFLKVPLAALTSDYYRMTSKDFSEKYGLSRTVWMPIIRKRGIVEKSQQRIAKYPSFTKDQVIVLIGSLLGDGGIDKNFRYFESHGKKQGLYLRRKAKILEPYSRVPYPCDNGLGDRFSTIMHPNFKKFREVFYSEGVPGKRIPIDFIDGHWDEKILAYWFLDDGSYDDVKKYLYICNFAHSERDLKDFCCYLENKLHWGFQYSRNKLSFSKRYYKDFFEIVLKVATPDMYYKIPEESLPKDQIRRMDPAHLILQPKFYRAVDEDMKNKIEDRLFEHYRRRGFPYPKMTEKRKIYLARCFQRLKIPVPMDGRLRLSNTGSSLCEVFSPCAYKKFSLDEQALEELWENDQFLKGLIRDRLRRADRINDVSIRRGILSPGRRIRDFMPVAAGYVYQKYAGRGKVLDHGSDLTAKMLAAMSLRLDYHLYEPDLETRKDLDAFGKFLWDILGGTFSIFSYSVEDSVSSAGFYDVMFSCSSYFKDLRGGRDEKEIIEKSCAFLKPEGFFAVVFDHKDSCSMLDRVSKICRSLGFMQCERTEVLLKRSSAISYGTLLVFSRR